MDLKNTYPASDFQIGKIMIARRRKHRRRGKGSGTDLSPSSPLWYGVEIDEGETSPDLTRIAGTGKDSYHATLPVQSLMKACLLNDDGTVNYYLDPTDWTKRVSGAASNLDGTDGQVMIEIPDYYRKVENPSAGVYQHKISPYAIEGFTKVNKFYVAAYRAALNRSTSTLASIKNATATYRGGDNNAAYDGTEATLIGKCVTHISLPTLRTYARNRGSNRWNLLLYKQRMLIYELFMIEYATLNSRKNYDATLTAEGYKKGGLGDGFVVDATDWLNYNLTLPLTPIGTCDDAANGTVEKEYYHAGLDVTYKVNKYRGIEQPINEMYELIDGINIYDEADPGKTKVYLSQYLDKLASDTATGYDYIGDLPRVADDYVSKMQHDDDSILLPLEAAGAVGEHYCDIYANNDGFNNTWRVDLGQVGGMAYNTIHWLSTSHAAHVTTRLCYIPYFVNAPTVTLEELSPTSVRITCSSTTAGVTGYLIERSSDGVTFAQIADEADGVYDDTDCILNTYYYRAKAYTAVDASPYSDIESITIADSLLGDGNTVLFLDANDTANITVSGTDVTAWKCKMGTGNNLTVTVSGKEPQLGSGEITFDGTEYISKAALALNQPFTIYMKVKQNGWTHGNYLLYLGDNVRAVQLNVSGRIGMYAGAYIYNNPPLSQYHVLVMKFNGASSSFTLDEGTPVTGNVNTGAITKITVGALSTGAAGSVIAVKGLIIRKVIDDATDTAAIFDIINAL